ncbi:MAG: endonuclease/exonuclease/phosphatase family protein [Planctomycetes bacterium]|nr:endonuclease/exonuclease/phosphatase family protein [Planctomycetota bacterium]
MRIRFGQFNIRELRTRALLDPDDEQVRAAASIIRAHAPDILSIDEMQYDYPDTPDPGLPGTGMNARRFAGASLAGLGYRFDWMTPGNAGLRSGFETPYELIGFARFPGQYGSALLSRFPIRAAEAVCFGRFLWRDLPGNGLARLDESLRGRGKPPIPDGFPLFDKSACDVPIEADGRVLHAILAHTIPPVYEAHAAARNADQLRFLEAYVAGRPLPGIRPLDPEAPFVVIGDLNCDPEDGEGDGEAMRRLVEHPRILDFFPEGAGSRGTNSRRNTFLAGGGVPNPPLDLGALQLQLDYILLSRDFESPGGLVHWPDPRSERDALMAARRASDHFFVMVEADLASAERPRTQAPRDADPTTRSPS